MATLPSKESGARTGRAARKLRDLSLLTTRVVRNFKTAVTPAATSDIEELLARLNKAQKALV